MIWISQLFENFKSNDMLEIAQVSKQINNQRYIAESNTAAFKVGADDLSWDGDDFTKIKKRIKNVSSQSCNIAPVKGNPVIRYGIDYQPMEILFESIR